MRRPERIVVCEGDTAEKLAYEFCEKHCPPDEDRVERQNMELKLADLLHQQIEGLLEKIDEDSRSSLESL